MQPWAQMSQWGSLLWPVHHLHHRWPSVFVFDQVQGPIHDIAPDGTQLPPNRDVMKAIAKWDGNGCLVAEMALSHLVVS